MPKNTRIYVHNQELHHFLFEQADCNGEATYHCAAIVLSYLKRMDEDKPLGKPCCGKTPTVKDMKRIMEFCVKHKKSFIWY